jgi:hypothetical protein
MSKSRPDKSGNCAICGIWRKILCRDRIVPGCLGGKYETLNIQWLCANCHQDKTASEQSAANKGKLVGPESRAKMSAWQIGKKLSDETKKKISISVKRSMYDPDIRARMLENMKGRENLDHWRGKNHSDETRAKISSSLKALPPKPRNEPWIADGISKTTYYRRIRESVNQGA